MKSKLFTIVLLVLLTACSSYTPVAYQNNPSAQQTNTTIVGTSPTMVDINQTATFKITHEQAVRYPPEINGTVQNVGLGRGNLKVTAQVFYAGQIASERMQTFDQVKPGENVSFSIPINGTVLWTSYKIILENN